MKKYISPRSYYIDLYGESLMVIISVDEDVNVDDDDKTRRQNYSIWDTADM